MWEIGFVYITGHGVLQEVITKTMETSKEFFGLPINAKKQILWDPEKQHGYVEAGRELFSSQLVKHFKI